MEGATNKSPSRLRTGSGPRREAVMLRRQYLLVDSKNATQGSRVIVAGTSAAGRTLAKER